MLAFQLGLLTTRAGLDKWTKTKVITLLSVVKKWLYDDLMTFEVARHACVCVPALTSLPILITSACRGRSSLPWRPNVYSSAAVCHNLTSQHLRKTPQLYPPKPWGTEESQRRPHAPPIVVPSPFIIMSLPGIRWTFQSTVGIQRAIKLHSDKVKVQW